MTYLSYNELAAEVERLREENLRLRHELEILKGEEEPEEEGQLRVIRVRAKRKGEGASYSVVRLNRQHRKVLYSLLTLGATSEASGVPAI